MDTKKIKSFIKIAKDSDVSSLKYDDGETKISVSFEKNVIASSVPNFSNNNNVSDPVSSPMKKEDLDYHLITAPFVGTFYTSASPEDPPYVKVGDKINKGQTLCILEAMKIMNEIESDISGEILEICIDNEALVEYGQPLFKIKR